MRQAGLKAGATRIVAHRGSLSVSADYGGRLKAQLSNLDIEFVGLKKIK